MRVCVSSIYTGSSAVRLCVCVCVGTSSSSSSRLFQRTGHAQSPTRVQMYTVDVRRGPDLLYTWGVGGQCRSELRGLVGGGGEGREGMKHAREQLKWFSNAHTLTTMRMFCRRGSTPEVHLWELTMGQLKMTYGLSTVRGTYLFTQSWESVSVLVLPYFLLKQTYVQNCPTIKFPHLPQNNNINNLFEPICHWPFLPLRLLLCIINESYSVGKVTKLLYLHTASVCTLIAKSLCTCARYFDVCRIFLIRI